MSAHRAEFPVTTRCDVLGVSTSGFYAWRRREPSARDKKDRELTKVIKEIHQFSRGTYGSPRILAELKDMGISIGKDRVSRLMRQAGLRGVSRRKRPTTTVQSQRARPAPDLVERVFEADGPDQLWVADITYVPTDSSFLYLAVELDAYSRRIVGWSMAPHLKTQLVVDALEMVTEKRQPTEVIHHSDQGCQYTSLAFGKRCRQEGVRPSMGSVGDCYDNAMCESFFATLECELIERKRFANHAEAKRELFSFIEGWYNPHRRHSSLGQQSPIHYEQRSQTGPETP